MPSLRELLTFDSAGPNRFGSRANQVNRGGFLFGGQLLAQSLCAAALTVNAKRPHSLQVSFEEAGRADETTVYEVHESHEGRSLSTRRVVATQGNNLVLCAMASFAAHDSGFEHSCGWLSPPPPADSLLSLEEVAHRYGDRVTPHGKGRLSTYPQVEIRPIDVEHHLLLKAGPARSRFWIRAAGDLPRDPPAGAAVLSYLSDYLLINAALIPHVAEIPDEHLFVASINHSMWFHAQVDPSQWMFFEIESPWAGNGRTLCCGRIFTGRGRLIASVTQEAMVRRRQSV
jgi:acyl-CoA thioesterase II